MELPEITHLRAAIRALPRSEWYALALESGVSRSTIEKIAYGVTTNPSFAAVSGLARAFHQRSVHVVS